MSQRGTLLGEPAPPPVPKSVFDYLSAKAKERLTSLTNPSAPRLHSSSSNEQVQPPPDAELHIPPLDGPTALAALKGFQPFSNTSTSPDPARQLRYTLYLQQCANLLDTRGATLPFGPRQFPSGKTQTIAELNRELMDYAQAARVFKPVSGMLAGRFTSGGAGALPPKVEPGLYQPPPSGGLGSFAPTSLEPELKVELTPAQVAARAGLFGEATRTRGVFRPAKLVCKRFGVRDPYEGVEQGEEESEVGGAWKAPSSHTTGFVGGGGGGGGGTKEALGQASMDALMESSGFKKFQQPVLGQEMEGQASVSEEDLGAPMRDGQGAPLPPARKRQEQPTLESVGLGDDEKQGEETLTYTKAPKDIFAAIFADSDDEDEDEEVEESTPAAVVAADPISTTVVAAPAPEPSPEPIALDTSTIADYRPSFIPTVSRTTNGTSSSSTTAAGKKKKKEKKRKAVTLSFDVEDEGEEGLDAVAAVVKKRKSGDGSREGKVEKQLAVEEDEWAEAPSTVHPEILKAAAAGAGGASAPSNGGRSKASDLF